MITLISFSRTVRRRYLSFFPLRRQVQTDITRGRVVGGHYHVTYKKPSPAMYSDYLPSDVKGPMWTPAVTRINPRVQPPALRSQSRAWSVMVTQSSSKEIWKRPWSVMATQSSNMEICKRRPRSAVVTQSSSKGDLQKKALVRVSQPSSRHISKRRPRWLLSRPARRFGKEGHGQ